MRTLELYRSKHVKQALGQPSCLAFYVVHLIDMNGQVTQKVLMLEQSPSTQERLYVTDGHM
jgi:hypothetical protein